MMSTREERIQAFQDTQNWIGCDPTLSASVNEAKKKTTIYYENAHIKRALQILYMFSSAPKYREKERNE